ncbi:MAG: ATP-binding protein [Solirubrobacterales bacterium]
MAQMVAATATEARRSQVTVCADIPELSAHLPRSKILYVAHPDGRIACANDQSWVGRKLDPTAATPAPGKPAVVLMAEVGMLLTVESTLPGGDRIGIALRPDWLEDYLASLSPPANTAVWLADGRGQVLFRVPDSKLWSGRDVPAWFLPLLKAGGRTLVRLEGLDGVPRLHAFGPLLGESPGLFVDVAVEERLVYAPINEIGIRSSIVAATVLTIALFVALFGSRRLLLEPIASLLHAARRLRLGHMEARARLRTSTSELQELGACFDEMAMMIETRERDLGLALEQISAVAGKLSNILESTTDSVVELDPDWRFTYLNANASRLLEEKAPVKGASIWEAFPALIGTAAENNLRRAVADRVAVEFEHRTVTSKWLAIRAFPREGKLTVFFRDITEAKAMAERSAHFQILFKKVAELLPVGIWVLDSTGRIVLGNDAGIAIWGGARYVGVEDFGQYRAWDAETGEPMTIEKWAGTRAFLRGEKILAQKLMIQTFDGSRKTILNSAIPLRADDGRIIGAVVVNEDVTGLEEARREADRANAAKSRFLAAASHDLRQPVQSMFFLIDALAATVKGERPAKVVRNLRNSTEALKFILDGLLDISKLDVGGVEPKIADIPLAPILEQIREEYAPRFATKDLDLRVVPTSAWSRTDPALLARILRNLTENALRYTETGKVVIGCRHHGSNLLIQVWDTGIGIPSTRLHHIWEEFFQVGNPQRDRRLGLGLGLAIVRRLAHLLGHTVTVHSTVGRGSVFSVEVPRARQALPQAKAVQAGINRGTVMVIEDQPEVLAGLLTVLDIEGFETVGGENLADAVRNLHGLHPDVVVADYRLKGGQTGLDAIAEIRSSISPHIPAIILTGDTTPELVEAARNGGCSLVLNKPVAAGDLVMAISEAREKGAEAHG